MLSISCTGVRRLSGWGIALLVIACPVVAQVTDRPNILLLMAEDMSSRVGAFGDPVARTPSLDALATQGVRYTSVFTTAGVCAPSRAAHILGMHQIATGTQHMRSSTRPEGEYVSVPPAGVKAYPELLRAAGYFTYTDFKLDYQFSGPFAGTGPDSIWDLQSADAHAWQQREPGQPFFGFINFMATHESGVFLPLGNWPNDLNHLTMQLMRWWLLDGAPEQVTDPAAVAIPPYYPDTLTVRNDLARHYDNIAYMDTQVGDILAHLEADGLADSTIVIWTTDHGDGLPRAKRELYDSGIRVPMIIRWPEAYRPGDLQPGMLDRRLISFVDLAPMLLALAGVAAPEYLHGRDFASSRSAPREYVYASRDRIDDVRDRQRAVRDHRYKYIRSWFPDQPESTRVSFRDNVPMVAELRQLFATGKLDPVQSLWFQGPGKERLYDLNNDPYEVHNLAGDPRFAGVRQRMSAALDSWLQRVGDGSEEAENSMVERIHAGGEQRVTPAPAVRVANSRLQLTPASPGHSLEYRLDDGPWRLYTGPVSIGPGVSASARAIRYGWAGSETVVVGP